MPTAVMEPSQTQYNSCSCGHFLLQAASLEIFMALQNSTKPFNNSKITDSTTVSELGAAVGIWLLNIL